MRKIRENLFETNSSSTHVITIANNTGDEFKENLPDVLTFDVGEYGWDFDRYDDIENRANYLFTAILYNGKNVEEYLGKMYNILKSWGVEAVYPEYIKEESEYDRGYYYYYLKDNPKKYFYIDHGYELDDFVNEILANEELLMNYLFSPESFIATGNDNSDDELDDKTNANNILLKYYKGN